MAEPAVRLHAPDVANPPSGLLAADLCQLLDLLRERLLPPVGLLDRDQLATLLNVGTSTFDRLRAAGRVGPRPVQFGGVKFEAAEVRAWLAARTPEGELHDASSWPLIWAAMNKPAGRSGAR